MLFFSFFSLLLFSPIILSDNITSTIDLLVILEHPKLIRVDEDRSSIEIGFEICFEWEIRKVQESRDLTYWNEEDVFGIIAENLITSSSSKGIHSHEKSLRTVRSKRFFTIQSNKHLDYSSYPNDVHNILLIFTSALKNSTQLTLNPHFVAATKQEMDNAEWEFEVSKAYAQWVVHKNQSFEQAVFELQITRKPTNFTRIILLIQFLINVLLIFEHFPVSGLYQSSKISMKILLTSGVLIAGVGTLFGSKNGTFTNFDYQTVCMLLLAILIDIFQQLLPFLAFHLRCCPIEADPYPPMFPSPSDQFSLESERSKCHAALDSARAESVRSPRVANFDMCLAEVKYTMSNFNEVLNLHSSAEWRRKKWRNAYRKCEIVAFIVLQIINLVLFSAYFQ